MQKKEYFMSLDCNIAVCVDCSLICHILVLLSDCEKKKVIYQKLKRKKKRRSSVELHKVLPTLKLVEDKKPEKKK